MLFIFQGRLTGPLLYAVSVCALGSSFQFGYNTGVVNAPATVITKPKPINDYYYFVLDWNVKNKYIKSINPSSGLLRKPTKMSAFNPFERDGNFRSLVKVLRPEKGKFSLTGKLLRPDKGTAEG